MSLATHEVFVNETLAETGRDVQTTGPRDVLCVHNQPARKSGDMESRVLSPTRHKNIKFLDCRKRTGDSHHLSLSGRVRFCQEHSGEKITSISSTISIHADSNFALYWNFSWNLIELSKCAFLALIPHFSPSKTKPSS